MFRRFLVVLIKSVISQAVIIASRKQHVSFNLSFNGSPEKDMPSRPRWSWAHGWVRSFAMLHSIATTKMIEKEMGHSNLKTTK